MKISAVFSWVFAGALLIASLANAAESDVDKLLDLLVKKGVVTQSEATGFRADLAVKKHEEKDLQKEFNIVAGKPIKVSGYVQPRYQYFQEKGKTNTFDIRRARLDIKGDITERFDYRSQIEFGGTSGVFLLDAYLGYKFDPAFRLQAGQFKIPFSLENLTSSPKLETINRSQVVEALVARGKDVIGNQNGRDIGIQASGSLLQIQDFNLVDYAIGVFNGYGINRVDVNDRKDIIGRVVVHPLKDLSIGSSFYAGRFTVPITKSRADSRLDKRDRVGAEFAYVNDSTSLKGEYIWGIDGSTKKQGAYIQAGYFLIPKKLQTVFKFDTYDLNSDVGENESNVYTIGANWYFNKWAFVQVNYEIKTEKPEINNNTFITQATIQF